LAWRPSAESFGGNFDAQPVFHVMTGEFVFFGILAGTEAHESEHPMHFKKYLAVLVIALLLTSTLLVMWNRWFAMKRISSYGLPTPGYQAGSAVDTSHIAATEAHLRSSNEVGQAADGDSVQVGAVQKTNAVADNNHSAIESAGSTGKPSKPRLANNSLNDLLARVNIDPQAPVFLTSADIDPASVRVPGTNTSDVMLFLRIPGKSPDELEVITTFAGGDVHFDGQVIKRGPSSGALWQEDGTNVGIVMLYSTRAEADAVAELLRGVSR
jgi:hypothetical protein